MDYRDRGLPDGNVLANSLSAVQIFTLPIFPFWYCIRDLLYSCGYIYFPFSYRNKEVNSTRLLGYQTMLNWVNELLSSSLLNLTKKVALFLFVALILSHVIMYGWNEIGFGGFTDPIRVY